MSADNGIYILETPTDAAPGEPSDSYGFEYRVRELMAVDNLYYDALAPDPIQPSGEYHSVSEFRPEDKEHVAYQKSYRAKYYSKIPDVQIVNARNMWKDCVVYNNKHEALYAASKLEDNNYQHGYPTEYGISFIRIDRVF